MGVIQPELSEKFLNMKDKILSWEEAVLWLKEQPDRIDLVRDCFYDDPLAKSAQRFYNSTEWMAVRELLETFEPGSVLDVGAGRGISSYAFARDGWKVTALEPDSSDVVGAGAIRKLIHDGIDITIEEEHCEQLPFARNSFDLVYGRAVLHHAADLELFCKEVSRVLKPGGIFLFTREHVLSKLSDLERFLKGHALNFLYQGEHAYLLSEYLRAFREGGLRNKNVIPAYSSDINLFPSCQQELFATIRKSIRFPIPNWVIKYILIPKMNRNDNTPGRLYTFYGRKK